MEVGEKDVVVLINAYLKAHHAIKIVDLIYLSRKEYYKVIGLTLFTTIGVLILFLWVALHILLTLK